MNISLYVIGTELTRGIISDKHIPFLCSHVSHLGYDVLRAVVLPDDGSIRKELEFCCTDSDVIIVTGGLGPTSDDLTRNIIAGIASVELVKNNRAWETLYARIGDRIHGSNEQQTFIPEGFSIIPNPNGTACGFFGSFEKSGKTITVFALPGPPVEMQPMFTDFVEQRLALLAGKSGYKRDEYSVFLIAEAKLEDLCRVCAVDGVSWGTRFQEQKISLYVSGEDSEKRSLFIEKLRALAGPSLIENGNCDATTLLEDTLLKSHLTVCTAESCTAGLVAKTLTDKSGSSAWFWGGAVSYANEAKEKILSVQEKTISRFGPVSGECAIEMADGIRKVSGADFAVSVTGIAGPDGAEENKPVGTVWFGVSGREKKSEAVCLHFSSISRDSNRRRACVAALIILRSFIMDIDIIDMVKDWLYI